jgi:type I restriction enzyme M protein
VKTQKMLRPAELISEVAENDYNLSIPRHVDTFEEEAVDLAKVSAALKDLEKEIKNTDNTIAQYCKELGIDTPF